MGKAEKKSEEDEDNLEDGDGVEVVDVFESTQCPEASAELVQELEQREAELQFHADNDQFHADNDQLNSDNAENHPDNQTDSEVRCPSATSNASDDLLEAALDDLGHDDLIEADALQRSNSVASDASDNLLEAAAEENEEEDNETMSDQTRLVGEETIDEDEEKKDKFFTPEEEEIGGGLPLANELAESGDKNREGGGLSKTTIGSISMVESSQPTHTLQKAVSSLRNRTDYASLTMDQTEVVDSVILSAEDDESAGVA